MQNYARRYLTRPEAAFYLSGHGFPVTKNTLQKFATIGGGPEYSIFGNRALYTTENLDAWAEARLTTASEVDERGPLMPRSTLSRSASISLPAESIAEALGGRKAGWGLDCTLPRAR